MKTSILAALLAGVATPGVAALGSIDALLPASLCFTYGTTYLVTAPAPGATGTDIETRTGLISPSPPSQIASSTQPSGTITAEAVIFSIVPQGQSVKKRDLVKRASGGFLNLAEDGIKSTCTEASVLDLAGGELIAGGYPVFTVPGLNYSIFSASRNPTSSGVPGKEIVSRTFNVDNGGYLRWTNETFRDGEAFFCQLVSIDSNAQVYIVFTADQSAWPPGCQSVRLRTFQAAQCQNGLLVNSSFPTATGTGEPMMSQFGFGRSTMTTRSQQDTTTTISQGETPTSAIGSGRTDILSTTTGVSPISTLSSALDVSGLPTDLSSFLPFTSGSSIIAPIQTGDASNTFSTSSPSSDEPSTQTQDASNTFPIPSPSSNESPTQTGDASNTFSTSSPSSDEPSTQTQNASNTFPRPSLSSDESPTQTGDASNTISTPSPSSDEPSTQTQNASNTFPTPSPSSDESPTQTGDTSSTFSTRDSSADESPSPTTTLCPFATSGSLITDGGFERGRNFFTTSAKLGPATITASVLPAASARVANPDSCDDVLDVYISNRGSSSLTLGYTFNNAVAGQIYKISFQSLVCGTGGTTNTWSVNVGNSIIGSGFVTGPNGGCGQWTTSSSAFVAAEVNSLTMTFNLPSNAGSDVYFDNFIIVPAYPSTPSLSLTSGSQVLTPSSATAVTAPSSPTASASSTPASNCPFTVADNLIVNGDLEDPSSSFFGVLGAEGPGTINYSIVSTALIQPPNAQGCSYALEFDISGEASMSLDPPFEAVPETDYIASFQVLACGGAAGSIAWDVGILTSSFQEIGGSSEADDCSAWSTYADTFTAEARNDLLMTITSGAGAAGKLYFDNFIVTPVAN